MSDRSKPVPICPGRIYQFANGKRGVVKRLFGRGRNRTVVYALIEPESQFGLEKMAKLNAFRGSIEDDK